MIGDERGIMGIESCYCSIGGSPEGAEVSGCIRQDSVTGLCEGCQPVSW